MSQAAANTFRMEVETGALVCCLHISNLSCCANLKQIRASEDILTLTRQMKEMWLFGQLNTLGGSGKDEKIEEEAKAVLELLGRIAGERKQTIDLAEGDAKTRL
jgi:hypothetical protein